MTDNLKSKTENEQPFYREIENIINETLSDSLLEILEVDFIYDSNKTRVEKFLENYDILNNDKLFCVFLKNYECIGLDNRSETYARDLGIYGFGMILELNDSPLSRKDFIEFSTYKIVSPSITLYLTFSLNISKNQKNGVYFQNFKTEVQQPELEEYTYTFLCDSFEKFLKIIFNWENNNTSIDDILNLINKNAD